MRAAPPLVTVIIPCFNTQEYLAEALNSVLDSEYENYEIIVVDDGSVERVEDFIQEQYSNNTKITCITQTNKGLAAARNTGILNSSGELLVFLDADDVILPEKLTAQVSFLSSNLNCDLVYSLSEWFIGADLQNTFQVRFPVYTGNILENLVFGNFIHVNTVMVRKEAVVSVGLFDPLLRELEDWDLWLRLAMKGSSFGVVQKVLSKVRVHPASMTANQDRMNIAMVSVLKKHRPYIIANYSNHAALLNDYHYSLLSYAIKAKAHKEIIPCTLAGFSALQFRFALRGSKAMLKYLKSFFTNPYNETTRELEYVWRNKQ